jgi:drug/metabolite transporter (DMT)-like permease
MKSISQPLLPSSNSRKAFYYMLMGVVTMGLMNMVAKVARETTSVSALHVATFRSFGMAFYSYFYCKMKSVDVLEIPKPAATFLVLRCVCGYIAVTCMFVSIFLLPFSLAMVLNFT